ncbi:hypothetical protein D3C87_588450 [compost metagenome]
MIQAVVNAQCSIEYIERTYPGKNLKFVSAKTIAQHIGVHINLLVDTIERTHRSIRMIQTGHPVQIMRDKLVAMHQATITDCTQMINVILKKFYGQRRELSGLDMFWFIKEFKRF